MSSATLTESLKHRAAELGFAPVGVCEAAEPAGYARFQQWLDAGHAGQMHYLDQRREAYRHPESILEGVASVVMLGYRYRTARPPESPPGFGRVSRYAWGESDYHDVIRGKLKQLKAWLLRQVPDARVRGVVDTAPLLERDFARMAGLGWIGKHTLLIDPREGSWLFLAALLTDHELLADAPFATDHCGTCRACLDACPTDAFPEPYVLDARRCISYLTIELQDDIPEQLREGVGDWAFGCDICQDVCPWNRKSPVSEEPRFEPREDLYPLELATLFSLDDEAFRQRFGKTPLWRAHRRGLLRNAAIVLGNQRCASATPALEHALNDPEPMVRNAAAWALQQIREGDAGS